MGIIGYVLAVKGWFSRSTRAFLPKLVTYIALPPYLMCSLLGTFKEENLSVLFSGALIPFFSILICFGLRIIIAKICRVDSKFFGLFCVSFSTSNTIFIQPCRKTLFFRAEI